MHNREIAGYKIQLAESEDAKSGFRRQLDAAQSEVQKSQENTEGLVKQLAWAKDKRRLSENSVTALKAQVDSVQNQLQESQEGNEALQAQLQASQEAEAAVQARIANQTQQAAQVWDWDAAASPSSSMCHKLHLILPYTAVVQHCALGYMHFSDNL